jgi:hypothetical protein
VGQPDLLQLLLRLARIAHYRQGVERNRPRRSLGLGAGGRPVKADNDESERAGRYCPAP